MKLLVSGNRDRWDPFQEIGDLQREMECLFTSFGTELVPHNGGVRGSRVLPLDMYETKDRLVVKADLPGVEPNDIDVSMLGNTLTITGERKRETETKEENFYQRELVSGVFQRQIELPQSVNVEGLKATYKNGILEISFQKREEAKPKQIKVDVQ